MNVSIERLNQIEQERQVTASDPAYRKWVEELNVSRLHTASDSKINAKLIMGLWTDKHGRPNSFLSIANH